MENNIEPKRAHIRILSRILYDGGSSDIIKQEFTGTMTNANGTLTVEYDDTEQATRTVLSYRGDSLLMKRSGGLNSRIVFRPGCELPAEYSVPEGAFDLSIRCQSLSVAEENGSTVIRIAYTLTSNGAVLSENKLLVRCTPC